MTLITQVDISSVPICNFSKSSFVNVPLKLMVLYKLNNQPLMTFYNYLYYFIKVKDVDIAVGGFNIDTYSKSRLSQILSEYVQLVEFPTQILL